MYYSSSGSVLRSINWLYSNIILITMCTEIIYIFKYKYLIIYVTTRAIYAQDHPIRVLDGYKYIKKKKIYLIYNNILLYYINGITKKSQQKYFERFCCWTNWEVYIIIVVVGTKKIIIRQFPCVVYRSSSIVGKLCGRECEVWVVYPSFCGVCVVSVVCNICLSYYQGRYLRA